jgi:hypothetical protein
VAAALVIGFVIYRRAFALPNPIKPSDAMALPGFKEAVHKRFGEMMRERQGSVPQSSTP